MDAGRGDRHRGRTVSASTRRYRSELLAREWRGGRGADGDRTPPAVPPGDQRKTADALRGAVAVGGPWRRALCAAVRERPARQDRAGPGASQVPPDREGAGLAL